MPPCGGVPYCSASRKKPKRACCSSGRHAQRLEDDALDVLPVNTDGARAQLGAVEHHVVGERAHRAGIALELVHVFVVRRGEGMVRGVPGLLGLVPLEHGEVGDPLLCTQDFHL